MAKGSVVSACVGVVLGSVLIAGVASCARDDRPRARQAVVDENNPGAEAPPDTGDRLVTGKSIDPGAAKSAQDVGSLPVNMVLTPGGAFAVTTDQGYRQALWALSTKDGKGASHIGFNKTTMHPSNGLYYGLAVAPDGTLYAAQGGADNIAVIAAQARK